MTRPPEPDPRLAGTSPNASEAPQPGPYTSYPGESYGTAAAPGGPVAVPAPTPSSTSRVIGWVGVGLLYVLAVVQLVIPTVSTFATSTTSGGGMAGEPEPVGLANWSDVIPPLAATLGFSLLSVAPVMLAAIVLGAAIGSAMPAFSRLSVPVRVAVGLLAAMFVPLGVGLGRLLASSELVTGEPSPLADPETAGTFLVVTTTLAWLPLLTAVFATAFGAAFAGGRSRGGGAVVVAVVGVLAIVPAALQLYDLPSVLTNGGPAGSTETPTTLMMRHWFMNMDLGRGAAIGAIVLVVSGLLGLVAVAVVVGSRARLTVEVPPSSSVGVLGAVVAGLVLVLAVVTIVPVLAAGSAGEGVEQPGRAVLNTWGPAAIASVVQVLVAVAGGAAIGWCRPLGRASLWLLLPLAPWLFVGPAPFALATFERAQEAELVNTWPGLVPGPQLVVGAVLVLALLFAGLRERSARIPVGVVGAVAAGLLSVLLLVQAQSILHSYLVAVNPDLWGAPLTLRAIAGSFGGFTELPLGLLYPLPMLVLVAALAVLGQLGTRRLALTKG